MRQPLLYRKIELPNDEECDATDDDSNTATGAQLTKKSIA